MKKVMIVDDEKDIRDSVRTILEKEGYEVSEAASGGDALVKVNEGAKPDLILMDIMMPGTPVKKIVPQLGVNVVYLSVVRLSDMERKDLVVDNVKGYIEKPFDVKSLITDVKKYIG